jgi:hypothetical protein
MNSVVELSDLIIVGSLHKAIRRDIFCELRKGSDPLVVGSEARETLEELAIGNPLEHFDLLPDEKVDPSDIISNNEVLVTQEL